MNMNMNNMNMEKWALLQVAENQENDCLCFQLCFAELKYYQRKSERLFELILIFQGSFGVRCVHYISVL